jgi:hypothetical protein
MLSSTALSDSLSVEPRPTSIFFLFLLFFCLFLFFNIYFLKIRKFPKPEHFHILF